jgi:hypothetical protein
MSNPTNPEEELVLKLALCGLSPARILARRDREAASVQNRPQSNPEPRRRCKGRVALIGRTAERRTQAVTRLAPLRTEEFADLCH